MLNVCSQAPAHLPLPPGRPGALSHGLRDIKPHHRARGPKRALTAAAARPEGANDALGRCPRGAKRRLPPEPSPRTQPARPPAPRTSPLSAGGARQPHGAPMQTACAPRWRPPRRDARAQGRAPQLPAVWMKVKVVHVHLAVAAALNSKPKSGAGKGAGTHAPSPARPSGGRRPRPADRRPWRAPPRAPAR